MANFLGVSVLVTLRDGSQLKGTVHSIEPQVSLTLQNVYLTLTGTTLPEYTLEVAHIVALETDENAIPSSKQANPLPAEPTIHAQAIPTEPRNMVGVSYQQSSPTHQPEHSTGRRASKFEDPAILSMGKRPSIPLTSKGPSKVASPKREHARMSRRSPKSSPKAPKIYAGLQGNAQVQQERRQSRPPSPAANLIDPSSFSRYTGDFKPKKDHAARGDTKKAALSNIETLSKNFQENFALTPKAKKPRKKRQPKAREDNAELADQATVTPAKETKPSKGWRQTPLLQPTPPFQPFSTLKKGKPQKNGWGTEDASDVQDMGDFDFESNLMKFDKHTVFGQIKAEDMTADEDRLVSHNRIPKPGTGGGKNLHYTENVLDHPNVSNNPAWNSEAGDSDEEVASHKGSGSGRTSRIADAKHLLNRRSGSRKASSITSSLPTSRPQTSAVPGAKSSFYLLNGNRKGDVVSANAKTTAKSTSSSGKLDSRKQSMIFFLEYVNSKKQEYGSDATGFQHDIIGGMEDALSFIKEKEGIKDEEEEAEFDPNVFYR